VQILPFILRQGTIQTLSVGLPEAFEKMNCAKIARMISQRYSVRTMQRIRELEKHVLRLGSCRDDRNLQIGDLLTLAFFLISS
jgi:hypothetical protein